MPSFSSAHKSSHVSPSSREHTCDSLGLSVNQSGCLTPDQMHMLGSEHALMDMTEIDYAHLQQFIQLQMEAQFGSPVDATKDVTGSNVDPTSTQAIDLSTSTDLMTGEKTPAFYGDVPGHVLARIQGKDSPTSSQKRSASAARVCLEKRFNAMAAERPQDVQPTVLNNFFTEAQEPVVHPQMQKWMKNEIANLFEVSSPCVGGVFNPVTNMCGQVIGHMPHIIEPNKQALMVPKGFSLHFLPEMTDRKAPLMSSSSKVEEQQLVNRQSKRATPASREPDQARKNQPAKAAKGSTETAGGAGSCKRKKAQPCASRYQSRERHNTRERERRKRIRSCCDELNMLVPFCDSDTDKATTLQRTTAYLKFIHKMHGDAFKEEFKKSLKNRKEERKGKIPKVSTSSGQETQEVDETVRISLAIEQ